jgi:hypothetical protein
MDGVKEATTGMGGWMNKEVGTQERVRVDLHLHSRASGTASNWWVRGLGAGAEARESYTPPEEAYRMAKRAGMDFVTLTDHETIDGALTLTHHPDFFVGEEVSAYFPEEGDYVDVLVYGLDRLAAGYLSLRSRRQDDVHLVVAGDGPYRGELEALLGERATSTGFMRGEELARLYASCDVFVFPSTTDTLGRAVAEAQASGLPAVVCGIGGPRECIQPGVSGFVVGPGNDEEFFSRVELLLDDAVARQNMGRAVREFAEGMSWEAVLEGLIELHSRLAGIRPDYSEVYARS